MNLTLVIASSGFLVESLNFGDSFAKHGCTEKKRKIVVANTIEAWLSEGRGKKGDIGDRRSRLLFHPYFGLLRLPWKHMRNRRTKTVLNSFVPYPTTQRHLE